MITRRICGNCAERVNFQISHLGRSTADMTELLGQRRVAMGGFSYSNSPDDRGPEVHAAAIASCPECLKPTLLYIKAPLKNLDVIREALKKGAGIVNPPFEIVYALPEVAVAVTSVKWPPKIQKLFRGAQDHHNTSDVPEMTISACRSVMEVAIKDLGGEGASFKKRITDLKTKNLITKSMEEWAMSLWEDGNAAVHEIEGTKEQAQKLIDFLRLFLSQVYDLPASIEEKIHPTPSDQT